MAGMEYMYLKPLQDFFQTDIYDVVDMDPSQRTEPLLVRGWQRVGFQLSLFHSEWLERYMQDI